MPLITFSCPACQKVLKSAIAIAAGTRVKCPTCGASFAMGEQCTADSTSVAGAPPLAPAPGRRRSWRGVLVAALLLVAVLGVGAYLLFPSGTSLTGHEVDPLAYVPPGAEFIAGADFPTLLDDPLLGPTIEQALRERAHAGDLLDRCQTETGLSTRELLGHAILAGDVATLEAALPPVMPLGLPGRPAVVGRKSSPSPMVLILKTSRPFDPQQVVRAADRATRRTSHGKTYYEVQAGELRTLYMPSDRVIVLSALLASELDVVLRSDGVTPQLSAETVALVRSVEAHPSWAVVPVEGATRARLESAAPKGRSLTDSLAKAKAIALWGAADGQQLTLGADVTCADDAGAKQTAETAEAAWKKQRLEMTQGMMVLRIMLPRTVGAFEQWTNSVAFTTEGTTARMTAHVRRQAVAEAVDEVEKRQRAGGILGGLPGLVPKPGAGKGR
jgi:hypothetical protein